MDVDDLLDQGWGVITLADQPQRARSIQRAAVAGLLTAILPGVYVRPDRAQLASTRIRAACAWSAAGTIHARTAVQLHLRQPITEPIQLRAPWRGKPVVWLRVSVGTVGPVVEGAGIRLATLPHALVELAPIDNGGAVFDALRQRLVTTEQLLAVLPEFAGSPGNRERRRLIELASRNPWSFAEAKLHQLLVAAGITGWVANKPVRFLGQLMFPDVWFPAHRLVLEFDGEVVHSTHTQFEEDRRRQNLMTLAGIRILRFTWTALTQRPDEVVAAVKAMLAPPVS